MKIKIFITGGTIDDLEYDSKDKAPKNHTSLIPGLLKKSRISLDHDLEELMLKDSRFINEDDRDTMLKKCQDCKENKIIITHGTATMPDTAKFLGSKNIQKTIVLTGAAIPANKKNSDALFNLGTAFSAVQTLSNGVYIVMNGKIFSYDSVKKNLETGKFETEN